MIFQTAQNCSGKQAGGIWPERFFMRWAHSPPQHRVSQVGSGGKGHLQRQVRGKLLTFLCSLLFSHGVVSAPRDCSTPGFSVHRIIPARILDWVATSSLWGGRWIFLTQGSNSHLLCLLLGRQILYHWAPGEAPLSSVFKGPKTWGEQVPSSEESRWTWQRWFSWGTVSPMKGSNTLSCYKCTEKELV